MNMVEVKKINRKYARLADEENYENEDTVNVLMISSEVIELSEKMEVDTNILVFGELRRRFQYGKRELERLIKN